MKICIFVCQPVCSNCKQKRKSIHHKCNSQWNQTLFKLIQSDCTVVRAGRFWCSSLSWIKHDMPSGHNYPMSTISSSHIHFTAGSPQAQNMPCILCLPVYNKFPILDSPRHQRKKVKINTYRIVLLPFLRTLSANDSGISTSIWLIRIRAAV